MGSFPVNAVYFGFIYLFIIKIFYLNQVFFSFKFKIESFPHSRVVNIYTQYILSDLYTYLLNT